MWPRQYAGRIIKLDSKKERLDYLENTVPEHLQDLTRKHVEHYFMQRKIRRTL